MLGLPIYESYITNALQHVTVSQVPMISRHDKVQCLAAKVDPVVVEAVGPPDNGIEVISDSFGMGVFVADRPKHSHPRAIWVTM